jgi:hypothetical protein
MTQPERSLLERFKTLVSRRLTVHRMFLFGSRARGDATPDSDMDVLVVTAAPLTPDDEQYISTCAWEAGFGSGTAIIPVVFSRDQWENSPERSSLLALAVRAEGIPV